jgi:hypothetical protein
MSEWFMTAMLSLDDSPAAGNGGFSSALSLAQYTFEVMSPPSPVQLVWKYVPRG